MGLSIFWANVAIPFAFSVASARYLPATMIISTAIGKPFGRNNALQKKWQIPVLLIWGNLQFFNQNLPTGMYYVGVLAEDRDTGYQRGICETIKRIIFVKNLRQ